MNQELPFGLWLKKRRKALDLTQSALAKRVGCSTATIEKIESEERRPSLQIAELLANALEIPNEQRAAFLRAARHLDAPKGLTTISPIVTPPPKTNVPLPSTPLVGREAELDGIRHLLANADCRLITLIGPGGIGKTRLAIEFALRQRELFPDGVFFAPLASINAPELIVPALADAFAFSFSGPVEPKEQLFEHLARTQKNSALLVLDNLEHLLAPSAATTDLIVELLRRCAHLKILCTSRERLNLYGEWLFDLHGLPLPPPDDADNLEAHSATALFLQAARRIHADFVLSDADKPALLEICRLLGGVPLALELAAVWVGMLSCRDIAREIQINIDFLAVTMRNLPERHRSLRASFDHSWRLLSDDERAALSGLSVFHGGWERAAAEEIVGAPLPLLASLVSKSLVHCAQSGRYDLHQMIQQYSLAHLQESPTRLIQSRDAHSAYYLNFAAAREGALKSAGQQAAVQEIAGELDNVRAAWAWALERENFAALNPAVRAFGYFFETSGLLYEGIEHFEPLARALQTKHDTPTRQRVLGQALSQQALLCFRTGHFERAHALFERALETLRPLQDQAVLADALVYLGTIAHLIGDVERSEKLLAEGLACAQATHQEWFVAFAIYNQGYLADLRGDYARARAKKLEGISIWRKLGDPYALALSLNYLALTLAPLNCFDEARAALQEGLGLSQRTRNRWGVGTAYRHLGLVEMRDGNLAQAEIFFQHALGTFGDYVVGWDIAQTKIYLGELNARAGDIVNAEKNLFESLRLAQEIHSAPLLLDALLELAILKTRADPPRAERWLTVIAAHPAATRGTRTRAEQLRDELAKGHARRKKEHVWTLEEVLEDALHAGTDMT
ncbi:MAG: hypothetical protein B6D41_12020 [Chloroflexi bacterium UTCFX4]|jgi:predicted ATPase/transcriptional regulator with XRE-family HTH domain|nr:MAG: hypothetical protein B6D41_12020 [Chloroflexi bacterium UTCFX4]